MNTLEPDQGKPRERHIRLLDTADWSDAILTGRDQEEDFLRGEDGLRITYDFAFGYPSITLNGPDGEIRFNGLSEIQYAVAALAAGARMAEADKKKNTR